jgi:hypothetical protein
MYSHLQLILFIAALFCVQCQSSQTAISQQNRLSYLSPPPHRDLVQVYFQGEKWPDTPYIKLAVVNGFNMGDIQKQAQAAGADAVLLLNTHPDPSSTSRFNDGLLKTFEGVAIRYCHNLQFVDQMLKAQRIYIKDSTDNWQYAGAFEYQINGSIKESGSIPQWLIPLSTGSLSNIGAGGDLTRMKWNQVISSELIASEWIRSNNPAMKHLNYRLTKNITINKLMKIETRYQNKSTIQLKILYKYDKNHQLLERSWYNMYRIIWREVPTLDPLNQKIITSILYDAVEPEKMIGKVEYIYYKPEDACQGIR